MDKATTTDSAQLMTGSGGTAATRRWLSGLLLGRTRLAARFTYFLARLRALSRSQRRRIARKTAGALAGAALLLALSGTPAQAATITVADGAAAISLDGICSLAEAIANANDTNDGRPYQDCEAGSPTGADTIALPSGGLFVLTGIDNIFYGPTGLPTIDTEVTIEGNGATIRRDSESTFRLLAVTASGDLTLNNVQLQNGVAENDYGGAILAYGDVTLRDSTISGSSADAGGAVFVYGAHLTLFSGQISDNDALSGSGLSVQYATASLNDTVISGNQGAEGWGGGGAYFLESNVTINNSTISGNSNDGGGGGIKSKDSVLTVNGSRIDSNDGAGSYGGGLYIHGGEATIHNTTISGNNATYGGGINQYGGQTALHRSLISGNEATIGGGVLNEAGAMSIVNSTISGNSAVDGGGAANYAAMTFDNVTVVGNDASGDGGGAANLAAEAEMTLRRSLIAGNTAGGQGRELFHSGKAIAGNQFNLFGFGGDSGVAGFTPGGDSFTPASGLAGVLDATLANNGGPTMSHALVADSPAIDRAPSAECSAVPVGNVDQRGQPRNRDADGEETANECDIGAIEAPGLQPDAWSVYIPLVNR